MKKVIILIICSYLLLSFSFVSAENSCKEEVIENITNPVFSSDWKSFAYETEVNWRKTIFKDWIDIWSWTNSELYFPIYSPDWSKFAYFSVQNENVSVVVNWKVMNVVDYNTINTIKDIWNNSIIYPQFSKIWNNLFYYAIKDNKWYLYKDSEKVIDEHITSHNFKFLNDWISYVFQFRNEYYLNWEKYNFEFKWLSINNISYSDNWKVLIYRQFDDDINNNNNENVKAYKILKVDFYKGLIYQSDYYSRINDYWISSDWNSFYYIWTNSSDEINKWQSSYVSNLFINWKKVWREFLSSYDSINFWISNDLLKYVLIANEKLSNSDKDSFYILKDWVDISNKDNIYWSFTISPKWDSYAYSILDNISNTYNVIKDWKIIWENYEKVLFLKYSPNWKDIFYEIHKWWKNILIKNWVELNDDYNMSWIKFTQDGNNSIFFLKSKVENDWNLSIWDNIFSVKNTSSLVKLEDTDGNNLNNVGLFISNNWDSIAYTYKIEWKSYLVRQKCEQDNTILNNIKNNTIVNWTKDMLNNEKVIIVKNFFTSNAKIIIYIFIWILTLLIWRFLYNIFRY